MLKKISLILNFTLLAAVIVLFVLHFTQNKKQPTLEDLINVTTQISPDSAAIAYIDYDSLLLFYNFYHELESKLEARKNELEAAFNRQKEEWNNLSYRN